MKTKKFWKGKFPALSFVIDDSQMHPPQVIPGVPRVPNIVYHKLVNIQNNLLQVCNDLAEVCETDPSDTLGLHQLSKDLRVKHKHVLGVVGFQFTKR